MRIRKRKVPLPLSSLSPVPLSDLRLEPLVQLRRPPPPPLDHPNQRLSLIRRPSVHSGSTDAQPPPDRNLELLDLDKEEEEEEAKIISAKQQEGGGDEKNQKINISRNPSISLAAHTSSPIPPHSLPSSNQVERWCDGDKAFPLKKRRGSFERRGSEETRMMEKMKTKMNNKCELVDHDYDGKREENYKGGAKSKRGGRAGAVVMEGSRCSRVNGRGWRCCQQTLVGYSLCEHHLGKGRLRSMTSVRSRSGSVSVSSAADAATAPKKMKKINDHEPPADSGHTSKIMLLENQSKLKSCSGIEPAGFVLDVEDQEVEDDEKKPMMVSKKRMKLGMVKARSMSSLLGQGQPININISYAVADDDDDHIHNHMHNI